MRKKLKTEKEDLMDKQHDFHTFKQAFHARRAAVRARDGAGGSGASGPRHPPGRAKVKLPCTPTGITQIKAKTFMPEGCPIWKSNTDSSWNIRVPQRNPVSRSWVRYGEDGFFRVVITIDWSQYCTIKDIPFNDCPIKGLELSDKY